MEEEQRLKQPPVGSAIYCQGPAAVGTTSAIFQLKVGKGVIDIYVAMSIT